MMAAKIRIGERVFLQADSKGHVFLLVNDVLYEPTDIVSPRQLPELKEQKKRDARTVAMKCVIYEYGPNQRHWPDIARSFVGEAPAVQAVEATNAGSLPDLSMAGIK
ncbi:MAG TPA: hypothetical protein VHB46_05620 [Burkholderiales bacterium]|nr:hypothetical protein [Burkholderiales bacterium]